ncbi:MAG: hypothetical protein CMQ38_06475 [Gammaproteobacteria bacterium]|nr:hypothetical protein [Gammaproteobacteria bacterium]|tara:strand:- start:259 stop:699 length:441 start_codon:yes stop_codon:yes gene_type:complete
MDALNQSERDSGGKAPGSRTLTEPDTLVFISNNSLVLHTINKLLQNSPHELRFCEDVFDGLCQVKTSQPLAVFIDGDMPALSGLQFCALLKEQLCFRHIRVNLITQETDKCQKAKALAAGANAVLSKPFGKNELMQLIRESGSLAA